MSLAGPHHSLNLAPASYEDYREIARRRLPRQIFDYIDGGSFDESTLAANRADLQRLQLRQRVLRDVSGIHLATTVMGEQLELPLILAPVGFGGMFARRAEVDAARSAERAGISFCESTLSICSIEEVAAASTRPLWFQLYIMKDRGYAEDLMARAQAARCTTLVLTVDLAVVGRRHRDVRNGISGRISRVNRIRRGLDIARHPRWVREVALGGRPLTFGNLERALPDARVPGDFQGWVASQFDPSVTWGDLEWLRSHWSGKIALKGILDPDDARLAVANGADAVIVSNHGGRQLDDVPSTISALPAIADAVGGSCDVLIDGGIRSGLDVVKALALGARACLVGRSWAFAVAARGEDGVDHLLRNFREDMLVTLGLTGVTDVNRIDASVLATNLDVTP
ncbi:MAG: L-lactate dehydrogenase [Acidimicrobiaceae bacterium]|nr:L-lactate dehydrogenase [Acidimicrobiaceae bacterium]